VHQIFRKFSETAKLKCITVFPLGERCLPVSPKPVSPKLGLGVGVYPIRRNPIRQNWGLGLELGLGKGLGFRVRV